MNTQSFTKEDITQSWVLIDAKDKTLGRLATKIANMLRGKHKPEYSPNADLGDYVVVINSDLVNVTGKKLSQKKYYRHTGYPGGIKEINPKKLSEKKPGDILKLAVKRMLPGGPLAKKQLTKLKIYKGPDHPHAVQNPTLIELSKLNTKNIIKN